MNEEYPVEVVRVEDLDDARLAKIGSIVISWNLAESGLAQLIWALGNLPADAAELITTDMGTVSRITLARNLLNRSYTDHVLFEHVQSALSLFDACREARNDVVHAQTYLVSDGQTYGKFSAKAGRGYLAAKKAAYSVEELTLLESAISAVITAMSVLTTEFSGHKPTLTLPEISHLQDLLRSLRSRPHD